jgi:hypothetical protein
MQLESRRRHLDLGPAHPRDLHAETAKSSAATVFPFAAVRVTMRRW